MRPDGDLYRLALIFLNGIYFPPRFVDRRVERVLRGAVRRVRPMRSPFKEYREVMPRSPRLERLLLRLALRANSSTVPVI